MKEYAVFLIQWIVWSGYTLSEWLSGSDRLLFNIVMFFFFLQIAVYIGKVLLRSNVKTGFVTSLSLLSYLGIHFILNEVLHVFSL
ncbi:MAG: hypothetical protein ACI35P_18225 [Bacillus sp. (in: firmicutes)]